MFYKRRYLNALALNLILIATSYALGSKIPNTQSCTSLLPKEALKEIGISFKGWRILEKKDIGSDDQILLDKAHSGECPGVAVGNYDGSTERGYAVLIIPQDSVRRRIKLLLMKRNT